MIVVPDGQFVLSDFIDYPVQPYNFCVNCVHCKFKEHLSNGVDLFYCHIVRSYLTTHSIDVTFHKEGCFKSKYET